MPLLPGFIRQRPALALFALLATAASGFGQTFFVSVFGSALREAFELGNTAYGALYSGATVCAALALLYLGGVVDRWPLYRAVALAVLVLAAGCGVMALAPQVWVLGLGFFLLRLGGQGLLAHVGLTAAGRYFLRDRGKVMALAASGFSLAEAVLPAAAVAVLATAGWRSAWAAGAGLLVVVLLPLMAWLTRRAPLPGAPADAAREAGATRGEVLGDPGFYLLLPAVLVTPFTVTAVLFHQGAIAEARNWPLSLVAGAFTGYAVGHLLSLVVAGPLVDRFSARRVLPLSLLPMLAAMGVLAVSASSWAPGGYLTLMGITQGAMATAGGALWPERYGVRHLGAIRGMTQSAMIVSTALSPLLGGLMLDAGLSVSALGVALMGATTAAIGLAWVAPKRRP